MNTKVNEGKLISGKDALIALANGEEVEYKTKDGEWNPIPELLGSMKMRLKPRTIMIGNIEVPSPFEPKDGDTVFVLANFIQQGYLECKYPTFGGHVFQFGAWRTEEEIKQVVAALRQVFGGSHDN